MDQSVDKDHNQMLIEIIRELNERESQKQTKKIELNKKINSVQAITEELPEERFDSNILKSYLKKFDKFKANLQAIKLPYQDEVFEEDLEKISRQDASVFLNLAKRSDNEVLSVRHKKYSNSKANLTTDSKMGPLRLNRYSS